MITRIGMAPRRSGLSADHFQAHWRGRHGDLAAKLPGVQRYWQNHAVLRDGEPMLPWTGFDACAEIDFSSVADMKAAFETQLYQGEIRDDEGFLIDKTKGAMILATSLARTGQTGSRQGVRLMTFLRAMPGAADALFDALVGQPQASAAIGREVYRACAPDTVDGHVSPFDGIDIDWFATAAAAQAHCVSAEARERRVPVCNLARGVERMISQVIVIVPGSGRD